MDYHPTQEQATRLSISVNSKSEHNKGSGAGGQEGMRERGEQGKWERGGEREKEEERARAMHEARRTGPIIVACQWNRSSPMGPAEHELGGSRPRSCNSYNMMTKSRKNDERQFAAITL